MMPRESQKVITVSVAFYEELMERAEAQNISVPQLIWRLLHSKEPSQTEGKYFVEVSERAHGSINDASNAYKEPTTVIVDKLLEKPAVIIREVRERNGEPTNRELIQEGLRLLEDVDPKRAEECRKRLTEIEERRGVKLTI